MRQTFDRVVGSRFIIRWTYCKRGLWFHVDVTTFDIQEQRKSDISSLNVIVAEFCEGGQQRYVKCHEDDIDMDVNLIGILDEEYLFKALMEDISEGEWANEMQEGDPMFRQVKSGYTFVSENGKETIHLSIDDKVKIKNDKIIWRVVHLPEVKDGDSMGGFYLGLARWDDPTRKEEQLIAEDYVHEYIREVL